MGVGQWLGWLVSDAAEKRVDGADDMIALPEVKPNHLAVAFYRGLIEACAGIRCPGQIGDA